MKEVIHNILHETLSGQEYDEDTVEEIIKTIANKVKKILEGLHIFNILISNFFFLKHVSIYSELQTFVETFHILL